MKSFAKINWTLDVLHRREDGFHEIRTIYQTVSLFDRLEITEATDGISVECNDPRVPCDESNLVYKAAAALEGAVTVKQTAGGNERFADCTREAGPARVGARIRIEKHIPVGGGLGGGSSNAAAALIGLNRLWGLDLGFDQLFKIAAAIGSDVPFFLVGGTALGAGRGEEVYPIGDVFCDTLLLASPGTSVSTASAYKGLKRLTMARSVSIMPFTLLAANGIRKLPLEVWNDLEQSVLVTNPEIDEIKRRLMALGARQAQMSGSGATVFGIFENSAKVLSAETTLKSDGIWCKHVVTVDKAEYQRKVFES